MRHEPHFVEELAARNSSPVGMMIPLSSLEPDPQQPRGNVGDLSDLVASIRQKGILEPILVRPNPEWNPDEPQETPRFRIISGERRYRAAVEAGLFEAPVIEMDVTADEALEITLIENLQRKDLTPFEEADGYRALAERHDYKHEDIARAVGKSRSVITESLALLQIPPVVREAAIGLGITSKSLLLEVLKAKSETAMLALLEDVASRGLSRDDLRRDSRRRRPAQGGAERRRPFTFKFRAPDKTFSLALSFRKSTVEKGDLIAALEQILQDLRESRDDEAEP
jgi:ParB family chromosome partitioning protein